MNLPRILIGQIMVEKSSGKLFKVLCSCPNSKPREHTRRYIERNRALYRNPTPTEVEQWVSKTSAK